MKKDWSWRFCENPENLPELALFTESEAGKKVKQNPFRSVRTVTAPDGSVFYVKHDIPNTPARIFKEFIRPKNLSEFKSAVLIQKAGLPCVPFAALGRRFPESVLVSRAVTGYISSLEFRCKASPDDLRIFFHALAKMIRVMLKQHIRHPDFHAGNLMVSLDSPDRLCLIDLFGIRRSLIRPDHEDAHIFCDFADLMKPGEGEALFREAGINPDLWLRLKEKARQRILKEWPRRTGQILCGRSKFARTAAINGNVYHIRNTQWFAPMSFVPELMEERKMKTGQAVDLWLESFRAELLHEPCTEKPMAFRPGSEESFLYYSRN